MNAAKKGQSSAKSQATMCSRVFKFLIGLVYIYHQVFQPSNAQEYIAELMVESTVTLEAKEILEMLNATKSITVSTENGESHNVVISDSELSAGCLIVEDKFNCNCSAGFIWSNTVCYNFNCCRETTCFANVSHITPLCISKVKDVGFNGSVTLATSSNLWGDSSTKMVESAFAALNGLEFINIINKRTGGADFVAAVSVKLNTKKLQSIVESLENALDAVVLVDTQGMVDIEAPNTIVKYNSSPKLACSFEEETSSAGWNMSKPNERFELNNGTVVEVYYGCKNMDFLSCVNIMLKNVTGIWSGTYECGFTQGAVRHTAKANMSVASLPEEITLKINPLTVDCSDGKDKEVEVQAIIPNTTEQYTISWSPREGESSHSKGMPVNDNLVYSFKSPVNCKKSSQGQYVNVTFKNDQQQTKMANVAIPVIYANERFCSQEEMDGDIWPKCPAGDTVVNQECPNGRVGYKSRTCIDTAWQPVFFNCVNQKLKKLFGEADMFKKGLGATQSVAKAIFEGLRNNPTNDSNPNDRTADISASINILSAMAEGSANVALQEDIFPDFVAAASNMLQDTWKAPNSSIVHNMASNYLHSVEGLVQNIRVNNSDSFSSENLDLKFCSEDQCRVSVFGIGVNLNMPTGIMKTVAVKNLMEKLRNNFKGTNHTNLLLSATLNESNSNINISLEFPIERQKSTKPYCVFWNTSAEIWLEEGCTLKTRDDNRTVCECNHLTSFSVLMAKTDVSTKALDLITYVGLGVSICSLVIFLIIEFMVWSAVVKSNLSHFRHTAMVNIAVFLLLADCSFLASVSPKLIGDFWCLVLTICKHLFFLAMFSWMLCMSVMLVHQLIFVFSPLRKRVFMFLSSIVGYVCPVLIVGCSYIYSKYTDKPYHNKETCWLYFEKLLEGSIHAFFLPVGTVIFTNLFSMVVVILTLMKTSVPDGKSSEKETVKSILKVVIFLTPVFGVTWAIGFFLLILDSHHASYEFVNYSFTILNSFQGFFILITGCFTEQKVREELVRILMAKSQRKSDSMKNLTSSTCTKEH
ncbi:adhesion G protein-coupled receptor F4-like isoform X1 [Echeneis naucrates]|uniref:adhesion G protein-coupled receptor F4-like isoform X1 n=1 Tax=Echeneis naucrates TaxID=173247 RepID=UPI00111415E7|nr:adhesion G protein-coupled receptor F4-like isoform X1 [Echeneis naucrates]XP_029353009.1 adhesion G protein-coupled receptor F4-like isoform X1 [Echeneis naucrates]